MERKGSDLQSAPRCNGILSTIDYWLHEKLAHILDLLWSSQKSIELQRFSVELPDEHLERKLSLSDKSSTLTPHCLTPFTDHSHLLTKTEISLELGNEKSSCRDQTHTHLRDWDSTTVAFWELTFVPWWNLRPILRITLNTRGSNHLMVYDLTSTLILWVRPVFS